MEDANGHTNSDPVNQEEGMADGEHSQQISLYPSADTELPENPECDTIMETKSESQKVKAPTGNVSTNDDPADVLSTALDVSVQAEL
jgi:hypothetical protein